MAKIIYRCILLALLIVLLDVLVSSREKINGFLTAKSKTALTPGIELTPSEIIGEEIIYEVRLGNISLGRSQFRQLERARINDQLLSVMLFETKLARFKDTELIYSDPQTLLPVKIERNITNWFIQEQINEDYDQANFSVTITKKMGSRNEKNTIKKDSHIHNAILLPHIVRRIPKLTIGRVLIANLPTRRFTIKIVSLEEIKTPAGTFKAYHFESTPNQIDIWISADERRIPLKIQSAGKFGYSLILKEYIPSKSPVLNQPTN